MLELLMIEPCFAGDHVRDHVAADDEGALEVDVEHRVPLLLRQLMGEAVGADAGVVEEEVDAAEALDGLLDRSLDRRVVTDVGHEREGADLVLQGLELGWGAHP
jgi:hypothetical protein